MLDNKFYFVRSQEKQLLRSEAEIFYAIHKGEHDDLYTKTSSSLPFK